MHIYNYSALFSDWPVSSESGVVFYGYLMVVVPFLQVRFNNYEVRDFTFAGLNCFIKRFYFVFLGFFSYTIYIELESSWYGSYRVLWAGCCG